MLGVPDNFSRDAAHPDKNRNAKLLPKTEREGEKSPVRADEGFSGLKAAMKTLRRMIGENDTPTAPHVDIPNIRL